LSYLSCLVIVAGICSLGAEMTVLPLLAPYCGTTQIIWASVVGVTLGYLTAGYLAGGKIADRWNRLEILCGLLAGAGMLLTLLPVLARPVLQAAIVQQSLSKLAIALLAVLALLAPPMILLGMASPFAVRLAISDVESAGRTAGRLFALSTLGSLLGTFLPVLVITPLLGTSRTFQVFGLLLSVASLPGLRKSRAGLALCSVGVSLAGWLLIHPPDRIRSGQPGDNSYEVQSFYNYILVRQFGSKSQLQLNECWAVHSLYDKHFENSRDPEVLRCHSYWDYVALAPFLYPDRQASEIKSLAMVGLGAGTVCQFFLSFYGHDAVVDGAEIDPEIIAVARRSFGMRDGTAAYPNFHTFHKDGRVFINGLSRSYDLVVIDCFRWPYVPSHLVTRQCFENVRKHLNPKGVLVVKCDRGIMGQHITATLRSVFPQVFQLLGMSIAVNQPVGDGPVNLEANLVNMKDRVMQEIAREALETRQDPTRPFQEWKGHGQILTDDHSPTEFLIHQGAFLRAVHWRQ